MADPLILVPGQIALPDDFNAVLQQHAPAGVKPVKSTQVVPIDDPALKPLLSESGFDPQQTPVYRYYLEDGTMVMAVTQPDGQYRVIDYKPSAKFQQQQAQSGKQGNAQIEGTPNGQGGFDNERPRMVTRDATGKVTETRELTPAEKKQWDEDRQKSRNPGGVTDERLDTTVQTTEYVGKGKDRKKVTTYQSGRKVAEDAPTNATATSVTYDKDGTKVTKYDDGTETRESPAPNEDVPVTVQGSDGTTYVKHTVKGQGSQAGSVYYTDQQGNRVPFPDDASKKPLPANAPKFAPDWNSPNKDLGLIAYAQQVRARTDLTKEQQDRLITEAYNAADIAAKNVNNIVTGQQQEATRATSERGQNVSLANQRLSTAGSNFGNALTASQAATKYATGPDAAAVLPYYLALAAANGQANGGMVNPPAVPMGPAAAAMQSMPGPWSVPSQQTALSTPTPAPVAPAANSAFRPAPPTNVQPTSPGLPAINPATGEPTGLASMLGAGPWAQQTAPMGPTGAGAVAMQSASGGYDPSGVNRMLIEAGVDPQVVNMFGGVAT